MSGDASDRFLEGAARLGEKICADAMWANGRCNWLGHGLDVGDGRSLFGFGPSNVRHALGPDLYAGTSGIALFLAHLHRYTGEERYRAHAEGAANHAISSVERIHPDTVFGFHGGLAGVLYSVREVGGTLGTDQWEADLARMLHMLEDGLDREHWLDMMSGSAGGITVLVRLRGHLPELRSMELATALGLELLERADRQDAGWSWPNEQMSPHPEAPNLTGFSHGAAGIGHSLLELCHATGDERFGQGAREAFRYESAWYDPTHRSWPDFRGWGDSGEVREPSYPVAWCHGAAGIGLSRLRAYELEGDEQYLVDARNALERTAAAVRDSLSQPTDLSLCHGTFGRCELLLRATALLREGAHAELARDAAKEAVRACAAPGAEWPCGVARGETPGLMLGLAGIGHFLLRLHDPTRIPSVLSN